MNYLANRILFAELSLFIQQVASESIKVYNAISDGTVNLVDKVASGFAFRMSSSVSWQIK